MPIIFKPNELEFKRDAFNSPQFDLTTIIPNLCKIANAKHLTFDVRSLNPGSYSFPYHFHRSAEELMMIISGSMILRSPEGFKMIHQGEIIFMETGESGAHQFYNHTDVPCVYLDVRTVYGLDVVQYPDSGKLMLSPTHEIYEIGAQAEYLKGEKVVKRKWKNYKKKLSA
jgi:uncharacterized cupin superfamily protein